MRLLALLAMFLLPISAFAQSVPPLGESPWINGVTVVHPAPGIDYYTDLNGASATVLDEGPGLKWYSAEDPQGRITSQGFLFDPMPAPKPLTVPESMRYEPPERRR
jgi:hypothetical protein